MYRASYQKSFRYVCGLYQQSRSQQCAHNHIDGPVATRFGLSVLRQRLSSPSILEKLRNRLQQLAERELNLGSRGNDKDVAEKKSALDKLKNERQIAGRNMALAETKNQYSFMAETFERQSAEIEKLEAEIEKVGSRVTTPTNVAAEIEAAMAVLDWLPDLAGDAANLEDIGKAFKIVNLRMYLRFVSIQTGKRVLQKLASGSLTFGDAAPPIALYEGPTARKRIQIEQAATVAASLESPRNASGPELFVSGLEGKSSGNVSRGDWI
jgi:hypothetical protein